MGRVPKKVFNHRQVDSRATGYYSTPPFVADFIVREMLEVNPDGKWVLDPCVGREELLPSFATAGKPIRSMDLHDFGKHDLAVFEKRDFLEYFGKESSRLEAGNAPLPEYDYYILNPPYNCHEVDYIRNRKPALSRLFSRIGTLNLYSMFISAIVSLARPGAVIGMITCDSFLQSHLHRGLRRQILEECTLHGLFLCPTDLFHSQKADVRTCIMILRKGKDPRQPVRIMNRPLNTADFRKRLLERGFENVPRDSILLADKRDNDEFLIGCPSDVRKLFDHPRLGEVFDCITGISTGNDGKHLSKTRTGNFQVPFFKNPGSRRFSTHPDGFLPGDFLEKAASDRNFMVRNRKFLFREGITCSSMGVSFGACHLPAGSTFGVNPNVFSGSGCEWWLLAYLNSSLATFLVRAVLRRSNMITSGYLSRLPLPPLSERAKEMLAKIAADAVNNRMQPREYPQTVQKIDRIVFQELDLSGASVKMMVDFARQPVRAS